MKIEEKIMQEIEKEAIRKNINFPSLESVIIKIKITYSEFEDFYDSDLSKDIKIYWEYEDDILYISYTDI